MELVEATCEGCSHESFEARPDENCHCATDLSGEAICNAFLEIRIKVSDKNVIFWPFVLLQE